jgi:hypothetical protein
MSLSTTIEMNDAEFEALIANAKQTITDSGQTYDETELRRIIGEALGRARTQAAETVIPGIDVNAGGELKIRKSGKPKGEPFFYESDEDRQVTDWYIHGRRSGMVPREGNLLIMGPSGSGKTSGVIKAGERLNIPVHVINAASITSIEKWVGERGVNEQGTYFKLSDVMEILRGTDERFPPGIALFDEITRLHATYHNVMFPVLDGQRRIWIPEMHDFIEVHPDVIVIATANIGGRFTGTYNMDHAMRERFPYTIERDFPPKEAEVKVITTATGASEDVAALLVDIANKTRLRWRQGELTLPISTRSLLMAAPIVRDGASVARAFEVTCLPMYSNDGGASSERAFVKGIISGKGGDA